MSPTHPLFPSLSRVHTALGLTILTQGIPGPLGTLCEIHTATQTVAAEVVGFREQLQAVLMPLGTLTQLTPGDPVIGGTASDMIPAGKDVLGRFLDGLGQPLDGAPLHATVRRSWSLEPLKPNDRRGIATPWDTGISILDTLLTLGQGQRVGIFAGAGLGKTTLLHQILRQSDYDIAVVALIGERGREAAEFWQRLAGDARPKTVVVCATAEQPPLVRVHALDTALAIADSLASSGKHLLLVVDSMTRVAHAVREVAVAAGELPTARGYPPSLFARLPQWIERAGATCFGTITALYTILLEADDMADPIGDAIRGLVDGHIILSRVLADQHRFPAIDPLQSLSRLQSDFIAEDQWSLVGTVRRALSLARDAEDLRALGAYHMGAEPVRDAAIRLSDRFNAWSPQSFYEFRDPIKSWGDLAAIVQESQVS